MSRTKREILDTERMLERLHKMMAQYQVPFFPGTARQDAEALRRISMTLHRWHELECGTDNGCIERGNYIAKTREFHSDENGKPYFVYHNGPRPVYSLLNDREKGALKRLKAIMARYPALQAYVQTDPRGCALYILKPGDVPAGEDVGAYYSRGLAVHQ